MPVYLAQFSYTTETWATLAKSPQNRTQVISTLLQQLGGRLINLYYAFGEYDGVVLYEAPDDTTAAASAIAALAAGHLKVNKTTKLLTVEEATEAMRRAGMVTFPPPGAAS